MLDEMPTYTPPAYTVLKPKAYDAGDGKYKEVQYRYQDITSFSNKKLLAKVNSAMRRGWTVTHWNMRYFLPSARLMKTILIVNTEKPTDA